MRTRDCPRTSRLVVPSGMRRVRPSLDAVPIGYRSDGRGSVVSNVFWAMVTINPNSPADSMARSERSRPIESGMTARG